jgi:hypothetical protein
MRLRLRLAWRLKRMDLGTFRRKQYARASKTLLPRFRLTADTSSRAGMQEQSKTGLVISSKGSHGVSRSR